MVNMTPLRLIAVEEDRPAEDDQSASPVTMITENEAITRKVPDSPASTAPIDSSKPSRFLRLKILLAAGAVAAVAGALVVATVVKGRGTATTVHSQPAAASPASKVESVPQIKTVPETIRLEITAAPMDTELSLDGNMLAGHWLNLEVPKDRGIHVVSASAPGYIPFNQQVSFSGDVVLNITLRRASTRPVRQVAKPRASQHESRPRSNLPPATVPKSPGLEPGMNLEGPPVRPHAKPIDERNPYKP